MVVSKSSCHINTKHNYNSWLSKQLWVLRFLLWWSWDSIILIQGIVSLGNWIMAFWGNMLSLSSSVRMFNKYSWAFSTLEGEESTFPQTLGSSYSVTQHHIPGEWNTPCVLSVCNCVYTCKNVTHILMMILTLLPSTSNHKYCTW